MPTQDEKLNIYPPSFFDPRLPGGIPSKPDVSETPAPDPEGVAKDACLGGDWRATSKLRPPVAPVGGIP